MHTSSAYAIYSPTIAKRVGLIKQHVLAAREVNGTGTLLSTIVFIKERDDELKAQNKATGLPAQAVAAQKEVFDNMLYTVFSQPLDSLFMIFNVVPSTEEVISNCLRDDIWMLEDMRDSVAKEMIKAYLMVDTYNGNILVEDFRYLVNHITLLKTKGSHTDKTVSIIKSDGSVDQVYVDEYLFGSRGAKNYYTFEFPHGSCPDGDFVQAAEEVWNAMQTLGKIGSGSSVEWDDIWKMAKIRAKERAAKWIEANQITLTVGGESGGNPQSLLQGGGFDRWWGSVKTNTQIFVNNVLGPVTPLFDWSIYKGNKSIAESACTFYYPDENAFRPCTEQQLEDYDVCKSIIANEEEKAGKPCNRFRNREDKKTALERIEGFQKEAAEHQQKIEEAERTYNYHMQLNSVSEQNIYEIDRVMFKINQTIKQGYEGVSSEAGKELPTIYNNFKAFNDKHCPNKAQ